ncbi:MAG: PrsW family intramembrane metalloprotease [Microterricola sp.]
MSSPHPDPQLSPQPETAQHHPRHSAAQRPPAAQIAATQMVWSGAPAAGGPGTGFVFAVIGIVLGAALLLLVIGYFMASFGAGAVVFSALVALIPLLAVLFAVRWIDRWEPEPRFALAFALLWGAGVAVAIALLVDLFVQIAFAIGGGEANAATEALSVAVQAPVVEEIAKGLGVLLLVWIARKSFDGPVDGLVYAAVVAAGFAFTENILYFGEALIEGGTADLGGTFVMRGIFSPFAHVMFTACTGIAIGFGVTRTRGAGILGYFALGLVFAIGLHALWNGSLLVVTDFFGYYFLVQVPLFAFAIVLVVLLRRAEQRATRIRLQEYADAGWFADGEVQMLATGQGRRAARRWARTLPAEKRAAMRQFTADATRLALVRQRIISGRGGLDVIGEERTLLAAITRDRAALLAPS